MKTIKESILSSTKSGKNSIIKQWCDEYIDPRHYSGVPYIITPDGKITESYKGNGIALRRDIKEVPSCIKFGSMFGSFHVKNNIDKFTSEQLPEETENIFFDGDVIIKDMTLKSDRGLYFSSHHKGKFEIKNVKCRFFGDRKNRIIKASICCENLPISLNDLMEFSFEEGSIIYRLNIIKTPAAEEIKKEIKKLKKKDNQIDDYLNGLFGSWPGLRFVELSARQKLEHSQVTGKWILY